MNVILYLAGYFYFARFATPLACQYRPGFGPPARIRKKMKRPPPENGEKIAEKEDNGPKTLFSGHFSNFRLFFQFSGGGLFLYFPIFSFFGPEARNLVCSRPTGSQRKVIFRGPPKIPFKTSIKSMFLRPFSLRKVEWGFKRWGLKQIRGYLRKKGLLPLFSGFSSAVWALLKWAKKAEKGEKGRFRPISRQGGQTPLKSPFVTSPRSLLH